MTRILAVDDNEKYLAAVAQAVLGAGFELVGTAATGEDALRQCAAVLPDLVLLDVHLPGIDGYAAGRWIAHAHPATRVILMSAVAREGVVRKDLLTPEMLLDLVRG